MLTLKAIKSILRECNIRPSKRLGQNFLVDQNIQEKIINAARVTKEDVVLEIGPGLAALTQGLCEVAKKVIAIEKDRRLYEFVLKGEKFSNLELIHGDILKYGAWHQCLAPVPGTKLKIIGNLPYYISSPILIHLLHNRQFVDTAFVTVQKEFAERLVARPGSKAYGSISCFMQFYAEPAFLFTIKRQAFYPAPAVDSCFLKIRMRKKGLYLTDEEKLFKIIRACFGKRRKTILNCLYSSRQFASKEEIAKKLKRAGISPTQRPETISLREFVKLTNTLSRGGVTPPLQRPGGVTPPECN